MNKRILKVGTMQPGPLNHICDVPGVLVGHYTLSKEDIQTGITAIIPGSINCFEEKVIASTYTMNGYGKSIGLLQIDELGQIETPILLTNTLAAGSVSNGLVHYMMKNNPGIGNIDGTVNSVVLECNDGRLNNIRKVVLGIPEVELAIDNANTNTLQGSIGAGTGMICHGLKGGIGSSSREIIIDNKPYYLGVLVNSNFGHSSSKDLIINGDPIGKRISKTKGLDDQGSIIVVVSTNIGLDTNQLKRVIKRAAIGIGKTGSYIGHGSGDVFVGFTTANKIIKNKSFQVMEVLDNRHMNKLFQAVVEATEEAIYNSMINSPRVKGYLEEVESLSKWVNNIKE
ncbi:MAG: P1 family peptidase [Bacilli bacterium]